MTENKWFDKSLTIIGLILAVISTFNLTGYLKSDLDWGKFMSLVSLLLGISIIILIIYKNKNETTIAKIDANKLYDSICKEMESYGANSKAVFLNPNKSFGEFEVLYNKLLANDFAISTIGRSDNLMSILSILNEKNFNFLSRNSIVVNYLQESFIFIMIKDDYSKMSVFLESERSNFLLKISKKKIVQAVSDTILKIDKVNDTGINLKITNQPDKYLKLITEQKQKFENSFSSLRTGHISFYGTEVQNLQTSWLIEGNFKKIRTLDLTTDPGLLLTRGQYLKANRQFINSGGIIERVFIISKGMLDDPDFKSNLKSAIDLQKNMGVSIGLSFIEELSTDQKQDFILYDDYAVLVEEKQANSDYSFGKSSAYFNQSKIKEYEAIFDQVWKKNGVSPVENLNAFLPQL